jgi:CRISPR/Cas system CMR-associated protein Cmr1 (group 7 of RAMP superfamily)
MKEKNIIKKNYGKTSYLPLPSEIIWLIFTYSDMATLARCSRTCTHWYLLSQPFWVNDLTCFLEKLKNELEGLKDIDVHKLVDCARENESTLLILSQLHKQEEKIEKYQEKLDVLTERQHAEKQRHQQNQYGYIVAGDPFGGCCVGYGEGKTPSFFGDIKRMVNKSRYERSIEEAKEREEKIIKTMGM